LLFVGVKKSHQMVDFLRWLTFKTANLPYVFQIVF